MKSTLPRRIPLLAVFVLLVAIFPAMAVGAATPNDASPLVSESAEGSALIDNGTVRLGVNDEGHLNVFDTGLIYMPTGSDAIYPGCQCEGWGVADAVSGAEGHASVDTGGVNVALVSFASTAATATSVVEVPGTFRVTHDFQPSAATPYLYEIDVTIENISGVLLGDLRYTRGMDWDVNPTPFYEYVTIQGTAAEPTVLYADNNGFQFVNPLAPRGDLGAVGDFVDFGPGDQGAHFDLGFGPLAAGGTTEFTIFYGAAGNEADALAAIAAVGATVYSLGQPTSSAPDVGEPNTFIFGYRPARPVPVDIKPTSCPNPFNVGGMGVLPMAILGTEDFDVTQINPVSVRLESVAPLRWSYGDVATPFEPYVGRSDAYDCNAYGPDGYEDLTLKFKAQEVAAALGEVYDGDVLMLSLTGSLREEFGGTPFFGEDVIIIRAK